jgi:two-component system sensor histidine kinase BarA
MSAQSSPTVIDRPIGLAELTDPASLLEVLRTLAELHGLALTVADREGAIAGEAGAPSPVCEIVCANPDGARRCLAADPARRLTGTGGIDCMCGQRWQRAPLTLDGEMLGTIALGPFWPDGRPRQPSGATQALLDPGGLDEIEQAISRIRQLTEAQAGHILDHSRRLLDVLYHIAWEGRLAGRLHLAALEDANAALSDKNKRLGEAVERMQEADRVKSSFLATVSHELRTPLTSVIGYSEMLMEGLAGPVTDEQRGYLKTILDKGEQLLHLITGLLDASRVGAGKLELRREPVDVIAMVQTVIHTLGQAVQRKKLTLTVRRAAEASALHILGDGEKVRQVLMNLVGNAVKFTPAGGRIEVVVAIGDLEREDAGGRLDAQASRAVRVAVHDTGIGIPRDQLGRIFEPFFQIDSSSTREYGGTGLGLTLVKSLVEVQGGQVWVDSEVGQGSVFTVTFPLADRR